MAFQLLDLFLDIYCYGLMDCHSEKNSAKMMFRIRMMLLRKLDLFLIIVDQVERFVCEIFNPHQLRNHVYSVHKLQKCDLCGERYEYI